MFQILPLDHLTEPVLDELPCFRSTAREVIKEYEFYFQNNRGQRLANLMKFNIFITTYEILLSDIYELREIEWRAIVIDEAHRLKNKNCKLLEGLKLLDLVSFHSSSPHVSLGKVLIKLEETFLPCCFRPSR